MKNNEIIDKIVKMTGHNNNIIEILESIKQC